MMTRRKFLTLAGATIGGGAALAFFSSDWRAVTRDNSRTSDKDWLSLEPDERHILYLASLAPSGHNTQPWAVLRRGPFHWVVGNDSTRWLPAVDPLQRETILSIGAFIQNLECAARMLGYDCNMQLLAESNQDARVMEIRLRKTGNGIAFDPRKITQRRTVRSGYQQAALTKTDLHRLTSGIQEYIIHYPRGTKEYTWLNENTIESNRQQAYRNNAQAELSDWIRLSGREARKHFDGLTTASMEIEGIPGWVVRNFYSRNDIMGRGFLEKGINKVREQVENSGGWMLIISKDGTTASLIETGRRLQQMLLEIREMGIAMHPMTQVLEEKRFNLDINQSLCLGQQVQFVLRVGYLKDYPKPVSLRRPLAWFVRSDSD